MYENYSIFVLQVNAYNREVTVTLKNGTYQVTEFTVLFRFWCLLFRTRIC